MPTFGLDSLQISLWISQFVLILGRLSFIVILMPGIGEQVVLPRVRLFILIGLSAMLTSAGLTTPMADMTLTNYMSWLLIEILIGASLGASLRIVVWVLSIAGSVIAQSIGLAQFLGVAVAHEAQTITANMLSMAGITLLLTADFHVTAFAATAQLFREIPIGGYQLLDQSYLINSFFSAASFALLLAWPFVLVNLLYNICLGFINKALPQLMVAFVGAPFMVGAGIFLLAVSIVSLLVVWQDKVPQLIAWL